MKTRCAVVALAGRPNVGKSTLVNAIVGARVAITADRPQTTRRALRGIATDSDWQLVLVDLPGVQRPRDSLTARMKRSVDAGIADADVVLFTVDAAAGLGPGDRYIAHTLADRAKTTPVVTAVNKIDRLRPGAVAQALVSVDRLREIGFEPHAVVPLSARTGLAVDTLVTELVELAPPGPFLFPPESVSDSGFQARIAELIREQAINRTRAEVPHALCVTVEEVESRESLLVIRASILVETPSQKGILVGKAGRMIRDIGTGARSELEAATDRRVHLDLSVRVEPKWRKNAAFVERLESL